MSRLAYATEWQRANGMHTQYSTTLEWLKIFRENMTDPSRWTQHVSARNQNGAPTAFSPVSGALLDGDPVCWCLTGWISWHNAPNSVSQTLFTALRDMKEGKTTIELFNDMSNRKHKDILNLLDHAIQLEEAKLLTP